MQSSISPEEESIPPGEYTVDGDGVILDGPYKGRKVKITHFCPHGKPITGPCPECSKETLLKAIIVSVDGTNRKAYYGPDGEQPWDTALRLGWAHGFAATNVLKYLRRVKPGSEAHSRESAKVYWRWLNQLAEGKLNYTAWFDESGVTLLQLVGSLTPEELEFLNSGE